VARLGVDRCRDDLRFSIVMGESVQERNRIMVLVRYMLTEADHWLSKGRPDMAHLLLRQVEEWLTVMGPDDDSGERAAIHR
jgi:hypothetical protein